MFWVDGESQQTIDILDRSFQYGDGCFTTMLVSNGEIQHFHDHQHRVDECLKALRISALDWDVVVFGSILRFNTSKITIFMAQRALMVQTSSRTQTSLIMKKQGSSCTLAVGRVGVATVPRISPSQQ